MKNFNYQFLIPHSQFFIKRSVVCSFGRANPIFGVNL